MFDAKKLLNQMFGASDGSNLLDKVGGMLGGLLNDSVSGMKDGAAAIEQKTGIGAKTDAALKGATGKSGADLVEQAKAFATQNKAVTGAALGGLRGGGKLLLRSIRPPRSASRKNAPTGNTALWPPWPQ